MYRSSLVNSTPNSFLGKLEFTVTADKALAMMVTSASNDKQVFLLGIDSAQTSLLANKTLTGEVLFFRHSILINSLETNDRYYFKIDDDQEKLISEVLKKENLSPATKIAPVLSLSKYQSSFLPEHLALFDFAKFKDGPMAIAKFITVARENLIATENHIKTNEYCGSCSNPPIDVGGGTTPGIFGCPSGGIGSTQCGQSFGVGTGIEQCEVTCASGYYSCCGIATGCKCYKIPTTQG